jgi:hypothetical protein
MRGENHPVTAGFGRWSPIAKNEPAREAFGGRPRLPPRTTTLKACGSRPRRIGDGRHHELRRRRDREDARSFGSIRRPLGEPARFGELPRSGFNWDARRWSSGNVEALTRSSIAPFAPRAGQAINDQGKAERTTRPRTCQFRPRASTIRSPRDRRKPTRGDRKERAPGVERHREPGESETAGISADVLLRQFRPASP